VKQRQLLAEAWDPAYTTETHYLRPYMTQLRRKLELNPARPRHSLTESGMGYRSSLEDGTGRPLADCTPTRRARY